MGLFGKIKNIFYDEEIVEVEVPNQEVKREERPRIEEVHVPKREPVKPIQEEVKPPVYSERELFKSETTFKFPVIDEEEESEPVRTRVRPNILDIERNTKREFKESKPEVKYSERSFNTERIHSNEKSHSDKTTEKTFRPSPVISPVYGVLDKNYKKDEIIERQHSVRHNPGDMNYDSVRRKAYGTLEDELENTLSKISSRTDEVMQTIEEVENLDTESNSKSIEDLLSEIEGNQDYRNLSIGEIEERIKDKIEEDESDTFVKSNDEFKREENNYSIKEEKKEDDESGFDKTLEHDLFNLIDSMYEEREGE